MIMSYMKSFLMAALVLLFTADLWAADVDAAGAQALARDFLQSRSAGKLMSPGDISLRLAHTEWSPSREGSAAYYVFNTDDAFVIVAGDDRAEQILAYGDQALDMADIPANMQWWLDQYKAQIDWLADHAEDNVPPVKRDLDPELTISPLLTNVWHQSTPFNDLCPVINGESTATGCVATAMAMVMNYWKYPAELPALPGYVTSTEQFPVPALLGTQLDWDNILDIYYSGSYTEAQGIAVATLLRYCGQACYMDYTSSGSGSWDDQQLMALKRFGYNREAQCLWRDECDDEEWHAMIMEQLLNERPVLYAGAGYEGAHAFVIDGCNSGRYHVNWGWGGGNGYYVLDALGSKDWAFNYYQRMQYQVYPDPEGAAAQPYDFEESGLCYNRVGDGVEVVRKDIMPDCYSGIITIPETVTHDGETLTVTSIASHAFMDCTGITEATLPATLTTIGADAFYNCSAMKTLRNVGKNKFICKDAFADCDSLGAVYIDDLESWLTMDFVSSASCPLAYGAMLYDKTGTTITDVVIPASMGRVKDKAFIYYSGLRSVTIEEGVTEIGDRAFYGCSELTNVTLPQSLKSISPEAFYFCSKMSDLTLPQSLQNIGSEAFYGCDGLIEMDIPGSLTEIGYASFGECFNLKRVTLNPGLERVSDFAFFYCLSLDSVALPSTVKSVDYSAFYYCPVLSSITLNENLQEIGDYAFGECPGLQEIVIPARVSLIGSNAFEGCSSLNKVVFEGGPAQVGESAFKTCSALTRVEISDLASWCNIVFGDDRANPLYYSHHLYQDGEEVQDLVVPAGVKSLNDYSFIQCEGLTSLTMGDEVKRIGDQAFLGCKQLAVAITGNGVRTIGEKAFNGCSKLTDFTFGSSVDSVGMYSFASSNALTKITSRAITPPYLRGTTSFNDKVYKNATVYVPRQSLGAYKEALVWKRFTHLQGVNFMAERADVNGDGEVTIADVNCLIDALLWGTFSPTFDVNDDGEVTLADVNAVIDVIISN